MAPQKRIAPRYIDASDQVWVGQIMAIFQRHVGKTKRQLKSHLAQFTTSAANHHKRAAIETLLDQIYLARNRQRNPGPTTIRREVFQLAAATSWSILNPTSRHHVIATVGERLKLTPEQIEANLYGDLDDEKILQEPAEPVDPGLLRLQGNLMLVQNILRQSEKVRILLFGNSRPIIRHAKWKGLICTIRADIKGAAGAVLVEISGPLSVLLKTRVYGKALAELAPYLGLCEKFQMEAKVRSEPPTVFKVATGDPIFSKSPKNPYDSKLEENFAKRFLKATEDWDLTREPTPVRSAGKIIFPDFAICHRTNLSLVWYLEIVGFWTDDYLKEKVRQYRNAQLTRLILCVRDSHHCCDEDFSSLAEVVKFRTAIDPKKVLAIIDRTAAHVRRS